MSNYPFLPMPAGACPVLTTYVAMFHGRWGNYPNREALRARVLQDLAPLICDTKSTPEVEQARAYVLADHAIRVLAPLALEVANPEGAARLRALETVTDARTAEVAATLATEIANSVTADLLDQSERDEETGLYPPGYPPRLFIWAIQTAVYAGSAAWTAAQMPTPGPLAVANAAAGASEAAERAVGWASFCTGAKGTHDPAAWNAARAALEAALEVAP